MGIYIIWGLMFIVTIIPYMVTGQGYGLIHLWVTCGIVLFILVGIPLMACMLGVGIAMLYCELTGMYTHERILKCDRHRCYCYRFLRVKSQDDLNRRTQRQLSTGVRFGTGRY